MRRIAAAASLERPDGEIAGVAGAQIRVPARDEIAPGLGLRDEEGLGHELGSRRVQWLDGDGPADVRAGGLVVAKVVLQRVQPVERCRPDRVDVALHVVADPFVG